MKSFPFKRIKRKPKPPCQVGIEKFLDRMAEIERIKDEFLRIAKLQRHEAPPVVTANNILKVAAIVGGTAVLCALIAAAYFSGHPGLQFVAACVSLLSFVIAGMGLSG